MDRKGAFSSILSAMGAGVSIASPQPPRGGGGGWAKDHSGVVGVRSTIHGALEQNTQP